MTYWTRLLPEAVQCTGQGQIDSGLLHGSVIDIVADDAVGCKPADIDDDDEQ